MPLHSRTLWWSLATKSAPGLWWCLAEAASVIPWRWRWQRYSPPVCSTLRLWGECLWECFLSDLTLFCCESVSVFRFCMMSMTLWFVMPMLFSALMIVCHWQVCSVMACGRWVLVRVFYACESLPQQDPKTNRGIGGIKILALPFRRVSSEPRSLTCSRIVLSGVYTASPRRCQPSSSDSLTANDRVSSACRNQTLL